MNAFSIKTDTNLGQLPLIVSCLLLLSGCGRNNPVDTNLGMKVSCHPIITHYNSDNVIVNYSGAYLWQAYFVGEKYCNSLSKSCNLLAQDEESALFACKPR